MKLMRDFFYKRGELEPSERFILLGGENSKEVPLAGLVTVTWVRFPKARKNFALYLDVRDSLLLHEKN